MSWKRIIFDIETNNLLIPSLDLSSMPYKLSTNAKLWCMAVRCVDTKTSVLLLPKEYLDVKAPTKVIKYTIDIEDNTKTVWADYFYEDDTFAYTEGHRDLDHIHKYTKSLHPVPNGIFFNFLPKRELNRDMIQRIFSSAEEIIGHNILGFDLPYLRLAGLVDYEVAYPETLWKDDKKNNGTLFGKEVLFTDTLVWSYLLWADRPMTGGKHGLEAWGKALGTYKIEFTNFSKFDWTMCVYNEGDLQVNQDVYEYQLNERQEDDWYDNWETAYALESKLIDLTVLQEVYGFWFDTDKAKKLVEELNVMLNERENLVEPLLPAKPLTKGDLDFYTPPVNQLKKNGEPSANMQKFAAKHGGTIEQKEVDGCTVYYLQLGPEFDNKTYDIPFNEPIKTLGKTKINDHSVVKQYLIDLGWEPVEWGDRDLVREKGKPPKTEEQIKATMKRYAEDTVNKKLFTKHRLEFLDIDVNSSAEEVYNILWNRYESNPKKPFKALTSPKIKIGVEKAICPNLEQLANPKDEDGNVIQTELNDAVIKALAEWYTCAHRRNSVGGGDIEDDGTLSSGYLSLVRSDGRISTPCKPNAANTTRYLHIGVDMQAPMVK